MIHNGEKPGNIQTMLLWPLYCGSLTKNHLWKGEENIMERKKRYQVRRSKNERIGILTRLLNSEGNEIKTGDNEAIYDSINIERWKN